MVAVATAIAVTEFLKNKIKRRLKMYEFFMPMKIPTVTHQEKQVHIVKGKPIFYEPTELKAARQKYLDNLAQHVPQNKFSTGVRLMIKWCFPVTEKHHDGEYND